MGLTGIMMWAKVWVGNLLARWWVDVATAVHFYEAILATLAILVWHFYQVFFDPDVYPMNWAWWDGKMPVEQYRHEHELDAESAGKSRKGRELKTITRAIRSRESCKNGGQPRTKQPRALARCSPKTK